jgi:hypothetical protein
MSSEAVRTAINAAVAAAAAPWPTFDLSDYNTFAEVLPEIDTQAVLIQYIIAEDTQMNIASYGNQGWEETGSVSLHMVTPTGFASAPLIDKGDELRLALRGVRLGQVVIESVAPFVDFGAGSTGIEGAWKSFTTSLIYYSRDCG